MKDFKIGDTVYILGYKGIVTKIIPVHEEEWNGERYVKTAKIEYVQVYADFTCGRAEWQQYTDGIKAAYGEFEIEEEL